jgi:hypothetical protein
LHKILSASEDISGFENTGVMEDEGQHLQTVYKPAKCFGGPGKFAFNNNARLDENSDLINLENKHKLLIEWGRYWNTDKPVLIEKSPPNLIRTRFLQAMFTNTYFITIIRHPIPVSYATQKWSKTNLEDLIKHWVIAHQIYYNDKKLLKNELFLSYEDMINSPSKIFSYISEFLGVKIEFEDRLQDSNNKYFKMWKSRNLFHIKTNLEKLKIIQNNEVLVNQFGYSLIDIERDPIM